MHFTYVHGPDGVWTGITVITDADLTKFDQNLFKAINGDDGGTWAPAAVITVGGAGMAVLGPLSAQDITEGIVTGTLSIEGQFDVANGGASNWITGSTATFEDGSITTFDAGSLLFVAGALTIGAWPTIATQTVKRGGLALVGTTKDDGTVATASTTAVMAFMTGRIHSTIRYPAILCLSGASGTPKYWLEIPSPIDNATLTHVKIVSSGFGGAPDVSYPLYTVRRIPRTIGGTAPSYSDLSLSFSDYHQTSVTWVDDIQETDIVCTTNNVIDRDGYIYVVEGIPAYRSSGSCGHYVLWVEATYTLTEFSL